MSNPVLVPDLPLAQWLVTECAISSSELVVLRNVRAPVSMMNKTNPGGFSRRQTAPPWRLRNNVALVTYTHALLANTVTHRRYQCNVAY